MKNDFDFETFKRDAVAKLNDGASLLGTDGVLTPLIKQFLEESLDAELDVHLDDEADPANRRNGKGLKRVRTSVGPVEIQTPRDRTSSFSPQLVPKRQRQLSEDIDRQILALYARGSSYSDIRDYLAEMYALEVSTATISRVTDRILPLVQQWRSRPLEAVYPFLWLDAIHFRVRHEGRVVTKAVHCVIGLNSEGYKQLLGLYLSERESATFWLHVLTDLKNRGVEEVLIACTDNLSGFAEAIESLFPHTEVQLCVVHQIRRSQKYIAWKDRKAFLGTLKLVYKATTRAQAELKLDALEAEWGRRYPAVIDSWRRNWERLAVYFDYPPEIRRVIYTTNIIESFHRSLRKVTKTKGAFTSDEALLKLLYLAQEQITRSWTRPIYSWTQVLAQLSIRFGDRLRLDL